MGKTREKPAADPNAVEVPLYTYPDAARYLHLPAWGLLALTGRRGEWWEPEFFFRHLRRFPFFFDEHSYPFGTREPEKRISFGRLAALFVRAAAFDLLAANRPRVGDDPGRWEDLSHAVWRGLEDGYRQPVPFDDAPAEARAEAVSGPYAHRLSDDDLARLRKGLTIRLTRVETRDGTPLRLFPLTRDPADPSPRTVSLDPLVRFGRPTVAGRGVPTDALFERFQAGDAIAELADDYGVSPAEVEEAVRYESRSPTPLFPFFGW